MTSIRKLFLGLSLVLGMSAVAHAVPPVGTGGGYYGSAWYGPNQGGSVVGPYGSYAECTAALNAAIANAVNNFHYTVSSVNPCSYRPPFTGVLVGYSELVVDAATPGESMAEAVALLDEITQVRKRYNVDQYEAELRMVAKASAGN